AVVRVRSGVLDDRQIRCVDGAVPDEELRKLRFEVPLGGTVLLAQEDDALFGGPHELPIRVLLRARHWRRAASLSHLCSCPLGARLRQGLRPWHTEDAGARL